MDWNKIKSRVALGLTFVLMMFAFYQPAKAQPNPDVLTIADEIQHGDGNPIGFLIDDNMMRVFGVDLKISPCRCSGGGLSSYGNNDGNGSDSGDTGSGDGDTGSGDTGSGDTGSGDTGSGGHGGGGHGGGGHGGGGHGGGGHGGGGHG